MIKIKTGYSAVHIAPCEVSIVIEANYRNPYTVVILKDGRRIETETCSSEIIKAVEKWEEASHE